MGAPERAVNPEGSLPEAGPPGTLDGNYIEIVPHPHSGIPQSTIVHLDSSVSPQDEPEEILLEELKRPWVRTCADFEYTATAVVGAVEGHSGPPVERNHWPLICCWLYAYSQQFVRNDAIFGCRKGIRSSAISTQSLQFQTAEISADFEGKTYKFQFQYRDPWKWILDPVTDPLLAPHFKWHPVKKILHEDGCTTQIYDEPNTGRLWWRVQDSLPQVTHLPHCFVPTIHWLDKGVITKRVRKHPIVGRLASLPSVIRNGSGNGGGVLFGYMINSLAPAASANSHPDDRDSASTLSWARFRREVYHKVCAVIFQSLLRPSRDGETIKCGDGIDRVLFPGIPFHSLDGEEACTMCECRAALANFPYPRCLVSKAELHSLLREFPRRTTTSMKQVYEDACAARNKTEREQILQSHGLHFTENFFWSLSNSDPYHSYTYDVLHADDLGKWGKHLWPLLLQALEQRGYKGLKHFLHATTCILPCIVQLLPKNSVLYRLMIVLHCTTDERITRLRGYIKKYEKFCSRVATEYGKNFNFPKQHATAHAIDDLREKGTTNHHTTPLGQGFHQEVKTAYAQTNGKNEDAQLARIDENQEAIALIRMRVADSDKARQKTNGTPSEDERLHEDEDPPVDSDQHWSCGSSVKWMTSKALQDEMKNDWVYAKFDAKLRKFLADELSGHFGDTIMSLEDWTEKRDILRCNPQFHGQLRNDFALVNTTSSNKLMCTHLYDLFICKSLDGTTHDVALVNMLKPSSWKPNTVWEGCRVYEEPKETQFLFIKYLIRGAYMCTVYASKKENLHYLVDTVDYDLFLRAGN
ncbi:hypothetical protein B0H17DRAFT_1269904 [Mycena rosella]|uniref:Transposase n=1 Tax=Mycena rosella TaxID=1033263 RepID=A0AAD7CLB4_MYCRO|nr:hypothetical protein B0H17DRAFT_1269904 [Mycena rosella]